MNNYENRYRPLLLNFKKIEISKCLWLIFFEYDYDLNFFICTIYTRKIIFNIIIKNFVEQTIIFIV